MQPINIINSRFVPLPMENIDTDQIIPARFLKATTREGFGKNLFRDWRYDASNNPKPEFILNNPDYTGQILVAGKNFGVGSSRPVAALFTELGVAGLVAEEFNSLFFRNAVNAGLPAMTVPKATAVFGDGDKSTFDLSAGTWRNETTGDSGSVPRLPDLILDILGSGGVIRQLAARGYLPAGTTDLLRKGAIQVSGAGKGT